MLQLTTKNTQQRLGAIIIMHIFWTAW